MTTTTACHWIEMDDRTAWLWIEMDDRTNYRVEGDNKVRVAIAGDDFLTSEDNQAVSASLSQRLGGTWTRTGAWSAASGETDVTCVWERVTAPSSHTPTAASISPDEAKGRAVASYDPRKPAVMVALKAASNCRKITQVRELKNGGFSGNCLNPNRGGTPGYWFVPAL